MKRYGNWSYEGNRYGRSSCSSQNPPTSYRQQSLSHEEAVTPSLLEHKKHTSSSPMSAAVNFKTRVDQACNAAEEFANLYYETMDKRRHDI
ncbi:hypothetical protein STEG23_007586 [Scotinomys teguina]